MNEINSKSDCLSEFCRGLGLHLIDYQATHHTANYHSWIDHCLVSDLDSVLASRQSSEPFLADHDLIPLKYDYNLSPSRKKKIWCRNWARIDDSFLKDTFSEMDLSDVVHADSVDIMNACLHNHIEDIIEKVAPLKEINVREQPAPLINHEIKTLQRRRSKLYRIYRRSGFAFKEYASMRKLIKSKISEAKKNCFCYRFKNWKNA